MPIEENTPISVATTDEAKAIKNVLPIAFHNCSDFAPIKIDEYALNENPFEKLKLELFENE